MNFPRESGILLHPTSLPGPYGIGEIGPQAYTFADTLKEMGQRLWQILPVGPTSYGDSPYQCLSTFAGNPLWISFDLLMQDGLLLKEDLTDYPAFSDDRVDFGPVILARMDVLDTVCRHFADRASLQTQQACEAFCRKNSGWLDDFALFFAIKTAHELRPWPTWDPELATREPRALSRAREEHAEAIRHVQVMQYLFDDHWTRLRSYCHKLHINLIGDIPIFVAHDSADAWAHQDLFFLDTKGHPTVIAGVPPDYFSSTGQRWGNPLYRWDRHAETGYAWWVERLRKTFELVDIVRIDHFRGFEKYWEIDADEPTAVNGKWVDGPKEALFDELLKQLGRLPIIAEDLGVITPEVDALRDKYHFPGMRILQFAFGDDDKAEEFRPESYPPNCVVYTGTHDNDTTVGWFNSEPGQDSTRTREQIEQERQSILEYLGTDGHEIHWDLIHLGITSKANTFVAPLQDLMGLDSAARMNVPGREGGNWTWRFSWNQLTPDIKKHLKKLTRHAKRG